MLPEAPKPEPAPPRYGAFWSFQDLAILTGLALPAYIISVALAWVSGLIRPGQQLEAMPVLVTQFLAYAIWFLCLWGLIRFRYDRGFWTSLAWVRPPRSLAFYAALGPVLAITIGMLGALLRTPDIEMPMLDLLQDRFSLLLVGAFAVTLGPLAEELIFRGFLLPRIARSLGPVAGILITSALFASLHGAQYAWSWRHLLLIGGAGAAFGIVRLKTGSTSAATIMHATYNLTLFVGLLANLEEISTTW